MHERIDRLDYYQPFLCRFCHSPFVYKGYRIVDNNDNKLHLWLCDECNMPDFIMVTEVV